MTISCCRGLIQVGLTYIKVINVIFNKVLYMFFHYINCTDWESWGLTMLRCQRNTKVSMIIIQNRVSIRTQNILMITNPIHVGHSPNQWPTGPVRDKNKKSTVWWDVACDVDTWIVWLQLNFQVRLNKNKILSKASQKLNPNNQW